MKRGFTLLELLVVVGLMAMLGTISVNGYRAVVRGMEERSAISAASSFIRAARQRAQIDNKPVAILYWNEMLKDKTEDEQAIIVGKAIAVRQAGRITGVDGKYLLDEFGDLDQGYKVAEDGEDPDEKSLFKIYKLEPNGNCQVAEVSTEVRAYTKDNNHPLEVVANHYFKSSASERNNADPYVTSYAFCQCGGDASFNVGDAYATEFAQVTLPHGYTFDRQDPSSLSMSNPTSNRRSLGRIPTQLGAQAPQIAIYSIRPGKGGLSSQKVGDAKDEY